MIFTSPPENFQPKFYVVTCYLEHSGEFLMLLRGDDKSEGNKWGTPGGKRDPGESAIGAVIREVKEETGIELVPEQIGKSTVTYERYPDYDFVFHMFHAHLPHRPEVTISEGEHKAFCWVSPKDALDLPLVLDEDACIQLIYG